MRVGVDFFLIKIIVLSRMALSKERMMTMTTMEPTEENLYREATLLQRIKQRECLVPQRRVPRGTKQNGGITAVYKFVASFAEDENAQIKAQVYLREQGLQALATRDGIEWLIKHYYVKSRAGRMKFIT